MQSLSNRYCLLKKSFNCALKIKRIPIPFFIGKDSQACYKTVTDLERLSITLYMTRKRLYQIPPVKKHKFFRAPIVRYQRVASTASFLFENRFWGIRANATQANKFDSVNRSFEKSPSSIAYTSRNKTSGSTFKEGFVTSSSTNSSRRLFTKTSPQVSCSTSCMHLPFQCAKLNTCSLQLNCLTKVDKSDCSCCSTNAIKKNYMTVRPLLDFSRGIITTICKHGRFPVYPDRSNQSLHYSRNRIRKQIIPSIQLFFNPRAEDTLFQFTELVLHEQDLVSRVTHTIK